MAIKRAKIQMPDGSIRIAKVEVPDIQPQTSTKDSFAQPADDFQRPSIREDFGQSLVAQTLPMVGRAIGKTAEVITGQPEAISDVASTYVKPIPALEQAGQFAERAAGPIAGAMVPRSALDVSLLGLSPGVKAPQIISKIARPIEKGLGTIAERVTGRSPEIIMEKAGKLSKEATDIYRRMLNPGKGEIKTIEVIGKKDINNALNLATEAKIPIAKSVDNKLDTTEAANIIKTKLDDVHSKLDKVLKNDKTIYNLNDLKATAREALKGKYKNAADYEDAVKEAENMIDAEIRRYGENISSKQLNDIKQGMWSVGYNAMKPSASKTARTIGMLAKDALQERIPNSVKSLNELSGRYATLNSLLENAHGRVVAGGKVTTGFGRLLGSVAGSKLGPLGSLGGAYIGGKVTQAMVNPERLSNIAISKAEKAAQLLKRIKPNR